MGEGDDVVYLVGWLSAVLAGVVVSVEYVLPYAFPSGDVVCRSFFCAPSGELVGCAVVAGCGGGFCAACLVADFRCSRHSLHRSSGSIRFRMGRLVRLVFLVLVLGLRQPSRPPIFMDGVFCGTYVTYVFVSFKQDSNPSPAVYKTAALPDELLKRE